MNRYSGVVQRLGHQPRTQPLVYAPDGDGYVVIGSNWGQPHHPLWTEDLLAHPQARVTVAGAKVAVRATLASGTERDRLWRVLLWEGAARTRHRRRPAPRDQRR